MHAFVIGAAVRWRLPKSWSTASKRVYDWLLDYLTSIFRQRQDTLVIPVSFPLLHSTTNSRQSMTRCSTKLSPVCSLAVAHRWLLWR